MGPSTTQASWKNYWLPVMEEIKAKPISHDPCDLQIWIKHLPQGVKKDCKNIYLPIDYFETEEQIAKSKPILEQFTQVIVNNHRLAQAMPVKTQHIEHPQPFLYGQQIPHNPSSYLLWIGDMSHLPWLLAHLECSKQDRTNIRILTNLDSPKSLKSCVWLCRELGLDYKHERGKINGIDAYQWTKDKQKRLMQYCAAGIDIKGEDFAQSTKPATKSQQFIANGIPFASNKDSYHTEYFKRYDLIIPEMEDDYLFSKDYYNKINNIRESISASIHIASVGKDLIKLINNIGV